MTPLNPQLPNKPLLEQMRDALRVRHYSIRTETSCLDWAKRYILFHHKRHPATMGPAEITAFLTHLAVEGNVAASTQPRPSAPSSSSTGKSCNKNSTPCLISSGPNSLHACQSFLPKMRSRPSSVNYPAIINSWPNCFMAAACASWNVCACA